ncbi:MAG: S1 family peptidase, partial [Pirellulaceae bacterium]
MGIEEIFEAILGGGEREQKQKRSSEPASRRRATRLEPMPEPRGDGGVGDVLQSVVQIVALREGYLGGMDSAWTGSGTVVHPQGLILTNCHVANPRAMGMSSPPADRLAIAVTERSDEPPAISYFAQVVECDPDLDLAVIRIVSDVRGRRADRLNLPAVHLGDSDSLELGDRISIFGYPGIGGETVTYTSGNVSGFTGERSVRDSRAWIKTDATIAGGNSGGTAVNEDGFLVGIPTQAAAGSGVTPVDARPVLDTNRDGRIDQRDTPMAVGGFINGLRPVNLAFPILQKAGLPIERSRISRSRDYGSIERAPEPDYRFEKPRKKASFQELLFCTRITRDGRPINPTTMIPSGIDEVFATFEFSGMRDGTPWTATWVNEGRKIIEKEDVWNNGEEGRKAVEIAKRGGVPDGEYHLVLAIQGEIVLEGKMIVGTPIDETDSEISGRLVDDRTGRAIDDGIVIVLKPRAS